MLSDLWVSENRGTFLGASTIRIILFWGIVYSRYPYSGNTHFGFRVKFEGFGILDDYRAPAIWVHGAVKDWDSLTDTSAIQKATFISFPKFIPIEQAPNWVLSLGFRVLPMSHCAHIEGSTPSKLP